MPGSTTIITIENSQNSDLTLKMQLRDLLDDTSEPPQRQPIPLLPSHHSTAKLHDNPFALLQILPLSASSVRGGGEEAGRGDGGVEEPRSNQLKEELELIPRYKVDFNELLYCAIYTSPLCGSYRE